MNSHNDGLYFNDKKLSKDFFNKYLDSGYNFHISCDLGLYHIQVFGIDDIKAYVKGIIKNGYDKNSDMLQIIYNKQKNGIELDPLINEAFEELLEETLADF
jgi:hypothetical protein